METNSLYADGAAQSGQKQISHWLVARSPYQQSTAPIHRPVSHDCLGYLTTNVFGVNVCGQQILSI
jgi:hypothetical protein